MKCVLTSTWKIITEKRKRSSELDGLEVIIVFLVVGNGPNVLILLVRDSHRRFVAAVWVELPKVIVGLGFMIHRSVANVEELRIHQA